MDPHQESSEATRCIERDGRMMPARDALGNRESEATPRRGAASHSVKAVEGAVALLYGYARPAVRDLDQGPPLLRANRNIDGATLGSVLDRVLQQVAKQNTQGFRLAGHREGLGIDDPQIDASLPGCRKHVANGEGDGFTQVGRRAFGRLGGGVLTRQYQHLVDEAPGAIDAREHTACRHRSRLAIGGALHALDLQTQGRQRRSQLVGRIGDEASLCIEGFGKPRKQEIDFVNQRANFVWQPRHRQGRQLIGGSTSDLLSGAREWARRLRYDPPNGQH